MHSFPVRYRKPATCYIAIFMPDIQIADSQSFNENSSSFLSSFWNFYLSNGKARIMPFCNYLV